MRKISVKVPASTSNLGSGFDCIGVALKLYLTVTSEMADHTTFIWNEPTLNTLDEKDNLILKGITDVFQHCEKEMPPLKISVTTDIPLARGLGSSASAYVAGLVTGNAWLGNLLNDDELFWLAVKHEGHPDNAGPAIFGGCVFSSIDWEKETITYQKLKFPKEWNWIAAIPSYKLSTTEARSILPKTYDKKDVVYNLSRYGLLINAIVHGNRHLMRVGLNDRLHQPYRLPLISGLQQLLERQEEFNTIGIIISGAGPTVLALTDEETKQNELINSMKNLLGQNGHYIDILNLPVDDEGYVVSIHKD